MKLFKREDFVINLERVDYLDIEENEWDNTDWVLRCRYIHPDNEWLSIVNENKLKFDLENNGVKGIDNSKCLSDFLDILVSLMSNDNVKLIKYETILKMLVDKYVKKEEVNE